MPRNNPCNTLCNTLCNTHCLIVNALCAQADSPSGYEKKRQATMEANREVLVLIEKCKIGAAVAIPHSVFPDEPEPDGGFWQGKLVRTSQGGTTDVGIQIDGEPIFTHPLAEAVEWLVASEH